MKIGVNTWVWTAPLTTQKVEELVPKVAGLGFDQIEFPLEGIGDFDYDRARELIEANGLDVSCCLAMGPDRDLVHPDEAIRANGMAYIKQAIEVTNQIGGTNLVGPIYSAVGRKWKATPEERANDVDTLVPALKELAEHAAEYDVLLGVEPLNRFETSFINTHEQVIEVVDRVDHPNLGVMLDTFHMNIEEKDLGEAIARTGDRLIQVHTCENDRGAPGSGNITWDKVAAGLKAIEFDGPVVIESFTADVESISEAAAIWRKLAPSQDQLAADGLTFLRELLG